MTLLLEHPEVRALLDLALKEDRVDADVTSRALVPASVRGRARVIARQAGILAGLPLLQAGSPLLAPFPGTRATFPAREGGRVAAGDAVAELEGPARELLGLERVVLNLLQRLSGIATATAAFVEAVSGTRTRIQETRKTVPGWRRLDKYAVAVGGGLNHRASLADSVLVKENHLALLPGGPRGPAAVAWAVEAARRHAPGDMTVEVEVEDLEELDAALQAMPDVVMLDDFTDEAVAEAVRRRGLKGLRPLLEVSGGITLERVRRLAGLGVDRISVGALTHSVTALDLAMELVPTEPSP